MTHYILLRIRFSEIETTESAENTDSAWMPDKLQNKWVMNFKGEASVYRQLFFQPVFYLAFNTVNPFVVAVGF